MLISIWRYSHLTLAISSFVFILIASITGIILAFEPISEKTHSYGFNLDNITISKTIEVLEKEHNEIISIEKDHNDFIIASVITKDGEENTFYINPNNGKKAGNILKKKPLFQFATNLHRSLFLKFTGRAIIGIISFLLFLIAITGSILILKRQGGVKELFSKVIKENNEQYYHVVLGRLTLIPIVIITISGVYLSLEKFSLLPKKEISHQIKKETSYSKVKPKNFDVFKQTKLNKLTSLEFPFSNDDGDYFYLKTKTKEYIIHQFSGKVLSVEKTPFVKLASNVSLILHTGKGSVTWSLILLLSTLSIFYFTYSGFSMTLDRKKNVIKLPNNQTSSDNAEYLILVGSETGATYKPAIALFESFKKQHKKVHITDLNNFSNTKNLKHLFILTSTYGKGEAPKNGNQFLNLIDEFKPKNKIHFSIVGFGSHAYPDFCEFAIQVENKLITKPNFERLLPIKKIHNQNKNDFLSWVKNLNSKLNLELKIDNSIWKVEKQNQSTFKVIDKTNLNCDDTYLITLQPKAKVKFESGDLLEFCPENETNPRYYSIAKIDGNILLSIKKHTRGLASNYFYNLQIGDNVNANIKPNPEFNFPKKNDVLLVSNGTGIAPFLGMLKQKKKHQNIHLFWGGRTLKSFHIYKNYTTSFLNENTIHCKTTYSREDNKEYVQHLIEKECKLVIDTIKNNGTIMICGSLAMESGVKEALEFITKNELNLSFKEFANQIKSDCY